jgi:hypothetical protein
MQKANADFLAQSMLIAGVVALYWYVSLSRYSPTYQCVCLCLYVPLSGRTSVCVYLCVRHVTACMSVYDPSLRARVCPCVSMYVYCLIISRVVSISMVFLNKYLLSDVDVCLCVCSVVPVDCNCCAGL